jgi:monodehydroascorbate reductase (NADH)
MTAYNFFRYVHDELSAIFQEFSLLLQLAKSQPVVDKSKLQAATSVENALEIARSSLQSSALV